MKEIPNLPVHLRPVALVPVGYPAGTPKAPARVPKTDTVEFVR